MSWIALALIAPFIWSLLNHLDKYLVSKYSQHAGIGGLAIISSMFSGLAIPILYFLDKDIFNIDSTSILLLVLTGILTALGILLYLYALDQDDASHVVPFWFLIPVFTYILGLIFLGENISSDKIVASIITLLGALMLSFEFEQGIKIKKYTPMLMVGSSLLLSLNDILFKYVTIKSNFVISMFWNQLGFLIFGVILFIFIKKYRHDVITVLKNKKIELAVLNVIGEISQIFAQLFSYYSILLAPVSIVLLIGYTFQPLLVFFEGILLTMIAPSIFSEKINHKHLIHKMLAILIMTIGIYRLMV